MDLRTTSAARSHAARSAPAHAAISAAIAAMPSLAWPRPVPGMASPSGITLAAGWACRARRLFRLWQTSFAAAGSRLECGCRPRFCRCYIEKNQRGDILKPTALFLLIAKDERRSCYRAGTRDRLQCDHDRERAKLLPGPGLPLPKLVDAALPPEKLNPGVPDLVVVGVILQHEIGSDIGLRLANTSF